MIELDSKSWKFDKAKCSILRLQSETDCMSCWWGNYKHFFSYKIAQEKGH